MILYDKKSNFLGISQSELSILGYEDLEEFKNYYDDFADLFLNHPGYISKFKNFSWIDYALHSGAPNRNVILKCKNGTEIEAKLQILEIFLMDKLNEESSIYNIEFDLPLPTDKLNTTQTSNSELKIPNKHVENENHSAEVKTKDDFTIKDYSEEINNEIKEKEILNLDENNQTSKIKVNLEEDDTPIPTTNPHKNDEKIIDVKYENFNSEDIDFTQIAEDTGMDLENIAMFIDEFIKESANSMALIKLPQNIKNQDFIRNEIMKLKGIASNLKMKNLTKTLDLILNYIGTDQFEKKLNFYEIQIKDLEGKLF